MHARNCACEGWLKRIREQSGNDEDLRKTGAKSHRQTHAHIYKHTHTYTHTPTHTQTHAYTHTHTHTLKAAAEINEIAVPR